MTMDRSAHSRLAVTYRRISSLNQVDNNSMCAQEQAIKDYAKKNHLKIVEAFHDLAKSGTSVQNRTGYQQMMEYLEKHPEVTCVLLHHLDRLHRNVRNQLNDIYTLKCRGIAVVTTDGLNSMDEDCMSEILDEAASAEKYS